MNIAITLFDRFTALDAVGPYETLQRLPDTEVTFVGHRRGEVRTENGYLGMTADRSFGEVLTPEVVIVPGGVGALSFLEDEVLMEWLREVHTTSRFTTSVCSGSLILAAAGLLPGLEATTYWAFMDKLTELGAVPASERVIEHLDERIITAAGVSSGIDMALRLAELLTDRETAEAMQLIMEYDPQPPFDAGSVEKAGPLVVARAHEIFETKG
ncbi:DJ-1/PfpI family protein [Streptomyces acidicola]|uniref:DJ-1/PfpI family protein n=1 Tax=Streptomyces acidicola TaxID=2596892 RepID=UPI003428A0AD